MSYFATMGTVWYTFKNGDYMAINDLTKHVAFRDVWKNDPRVQLVYKIKDGELPHQISNKLYETVDYWWSVLLFNNIYDFENQWPRSQQQLDDYIADKYPFNEPNDVHHYVAPNGTVSDILSAKVLYGVGTDETAIYLAGLVPVTIFDYEHAINELKRSIILVDPDYIDSVASEFEVLMNGG